MEIEQHFDSEEITAVYSWSVMSSMPVCKLAHISYLNLSRAGLTSVPAVIWSDMPSVAHLNLSFNQIRSIEIPKSFSLKYLNMSCNLLQSIDGLHPVASTIEQFYLAGNQIRTFPHRLAQNLECLRILEMGSECLGGNRLSNIDSLCEITTLTSLDISNNMSVSIPESIGNLLNLKHLNATNNQISFIAKSIGSLLNLESLNLAKNCITVIPNELSLLSHLKAVDLSQNMISHIDSTLLSFLSKRSFLISRNPFNCRMRTKSIRLPTGGVNSLFELSARALICNDSTVAHNFPEHIENYLRYSSLRKCTVCRNQIICEYSTRIQKDTNLLGFEIPCVHYLCSKRCFQKSSTYHNLDW